MYNMQYFLYEMWKIYILYINNFIKDKQQIKLLIFFKRKTTWTGTYIVHTDTNMAKF